MLTGASSLNDTVSYADATAAVTVSLAITSQQNTIGAGLDTLTKIEHLIGSDYNDKLTGNWKNIVLEGEIGNDRLNGKAGADSLIGGPGDDRYVIDNVGDVITENSGEGTDTVYSSVTYTLPPMLKNSS